MATPAIVFDGVWKKFRRGERHDSLRDLIPGVARRLLGRAPEPTDLASDEFWVLRDVSFEVRPGEALGIIGHNGAGKSTALKLLTRLLRPTRGHANVHGRVGALIEIAAGFHPDLTGRENVYLQGAIMGMRRTEIQRHFDAIVAFSGLEEFIDTPVKRYSSGMNARLGFSIAAHLDPDVLLIDEVLAVGDFTFQQKCYERLREFRRGGTAIAFVSHNMQAISSLCDRVLLLRRDAPVLLGEVGDVLAAYLATGQGSADDRVRLHHTALEVSGARGEDGRPLPPIRPGTGLTLTVQVEAMEPLAGTLIGFEVIRADGATVFNGSPMFDGAPSIDFTPGVIQDIQLDFRAHLLRGTYLITLHLVDERRLWRPIALPMVGSFVVDETTRVGGYAELYPVLRVSTVSSSRVPVHAASARGSDG